MGGLGVGGWGGWSIKVLSLKSDSPLGYYTHSWGELRPIVGGIASDVGSNHPDQFWQPGFRNP